jgi:DNA-binding transcriptional ArsR family regulator
MIRNRMVSRAPARGRAPAPEVDVFAALADRHRREILGLLTAREMSIRSIAANFTVTRPAVAKHLGVLERARLVRTRRLGRERLCRMEAGPLRAVRDWVQTYERFWTARLQAAEGGCRAGVRTR